METKAQRKLKRSNIYLTVAIIALLTYLIVVPIVTIVQLYSVQQSLLTQQNEAEKQAQHRLQEEFENNERQNEKILNYMRCLAIVLSDDTRANVIKDIDKCELQKKAATSKNNQPAVAPIPQQVVAPPLQPTTTSEPPTPDAVPAPSAPVSQTEPPVEAQPEKRSGVLGVVDRTLDGVRNILRTTTDSINDILGGK